MWVAAAAKAALQVLLGEPFEPEQPLSQGSDQPSLQVPVYSAAPLAPGEALGISRCDPGPGLDLTRDLEVWVRVAWIAASQPVLELQAGEGVGRFGAEGDVCLSGFARELLERNLLPLVPPGRGLLVQPILPRGRVLAERTSNAAFGVVDGLALIGTQAEVQRSAAPDQLALALAELRRRAERPGGCPELVLVLGENGLDLAPRLGLPAELLLKCGNWIAPLLAAAAQQGVQRLLLFGYHGKLIKLAGGIFHTHHHLADGRAEVLTALAALEGLQGEALVALHQAPTVDAALTALQRQQPELEQRLRARLCAVIERRAAASILATTGLELQPGVALFDRSRQLWALGPEGRHWWGPAAI